MLGTCFILTTFQLCFGDALLGGQKSRARPLLGFATVGLLGVSEETFFFSLVGAEFNANISDIDPHGVDNLGLVGPTKCEGIAAWNLVDWKEERCTF